MVIVVTVIVTMIVMGFRREGTGAMVISMGVVVMLDFVTARLARMRADQRDHCRDEGADQRQQNDCLDHNAR
jgi:hypothetical protein